MRTLKLFLHFVLERFSSGLDIHSAKITRLMEYLMVSFRFDWLENASPMLSKYSQPMAILDSRSNFPVDRI